MSRILVLNAGSSSLKFAGFDQDLRESCRGAISGLGHHARFKMSGGKAGPEREDFAPGPLAMDAALDFVFDRLAARGETDGLAAIGHRIVHGGERFTRPAELTPDVLEALRALEPLAPLHQPYNLAIVAAAAARFPDARQVGAFDTAFHAGRPELQKLYGLPRALIDEGIVAYGFHGLSFQFIAGQLRQRFGAGAGGRAIVLHLGSGSSICAMEGGASLATTMGFSPLDGPVMATRCGAIDPGVLLHLMLRRQMTPEAVEDMLYRRSGLAGLSGTSGDMQMLLAATTREARQAIDYFILTVCRQVGALVATMGGVDRLVFTAGIGENAASVRALLAARLGWLGVSLDEAANEKGQLDIAAPGSAVAVHVIATDEERAVAEGAAGLLDRR